MRQHACGLAQELLPYLLVWEIDSEFLDERSGSRERLLGFGLSYLGLIEPAQGNAYTPEPWPKPLCMRSFLCRSQHGLGFCCPMKRRQRLTAQLPKAGDDTLVRQICGGCDQPIGDVQRQSRVTASQGEVGACGPDEPLPNGLHSRISFKRSSEDRVSLREVILQKIRTGKKRRDYTDPVPGADFVGQGERAFE